jgi:glycosyltransferase involved in cell wall biosynthesis
MRVSVVVPTYRRPDLLERCLTALARQRLSADQFEVVVADDAADEQTREQVEKLAGGAMPLSYVPVTGNHGPAAARNAGWRAARGEIIAFTDDDCIPDSGWLAEGVKPFADPAVIAVTGQTIVPLPAAPTDYERNTANLEHCEFITANCFCRREALVALGGFDEQFTKAWREDSDLHFRLLDTGGVIRKATQAVVVHPARTARFGACLGEQRKVFFDALLFRKHPRHFRERIRPLWPWHYYVIVLSAIVAVSAAVGGQRWLAVALLLVWLAFTVRFVARRLERTSRSPGHIAEMSVTSLAIPFLSIFWRLYGAARFRVLFW